ncbi:probable ribose-5-phosphate isomerase 4, chloroplastic isoform X3 [Herrania umbratica]|uniref:ribose-5-phosphate isomerase n=1 Tax=Herrania umbratica TaxID=108875 RepID=A0A6J1BFQ0_9ROSI|nr:probable ribose-5-phosphate isomerase 4, chloroplastic isoform X3 [Herrania umbratica]
MASAIPHLHFPVTWKSNPRIRKRKPATATATACSLSEASPLFRAAKHTVLHSTINFLLVFFTYMILLNCKFLYNWENVLWVDTFVKSGMVIGLGSGQASGMAIEYLGRQLRAGALKDLVGIPTSVVSASEAAKAGIPLGEYENSSQIDFAFDDVDIIEEGTLISVIGRRRLQGEESIIQEKLVLSIADQLVFMVKEDLYKCGLEGSIPVLVESLNWLETAEEIDDLFLGDAEVWRRPSVGHAGPLGGDFPLVTTEGHNVLDVIFTSPIASLAEVANSLEKVDGVVDHGVVSKFPDALTVQARISCCIPPHPHPKSGQNKHM